MKEYENITVELTPEEVGALTRLASRELSIEPAWGQEGFFNIEATSYVGTVDLGTTRIEIRPKIGINRLLFLLSYSVDPRDWERLEADFEPQHSLYETMLPGFIRQVGRATERGLLKGYRREETALQGIRGRVRFDDQLRRRFGIFPPAEVVYDEFDEDIEENRLIKAASTRLGRMRIRSLELLPLLRRIDATFLDISPVPYDPVNLPELSYTRLNQHYAPAVELAKIVLRNTSFDTQAGNVRSSSFLLNMNEVFELFVWTALRETLKAPSREFPLGGRGRTLHLDVDRRLGLKPDLSWWKGSHCIFVGDVKYKDLDSGPVREHDMYQLVSYMSATNLRAGLLVYGSRSGVRERYRLRNTDADVRVVGLGLDQDPTLILRDVEELGHTVRQLVAVDPRRTEAA